MDPYSSIAQFYDLEHDDFQDDITFYRLLAPESPVLEVGVGTGRVMAALREAGVDVCGVDPSIAMLQLARQRLGPAARLVQGAIETVDLPQRFRTVILSLNTLSHFPSTTAQLAALRAVRTHLEDGGTVVIDLSNPLTLADRGSSGEVRSRFVSSLPDRTIMACSAAWEDEAEQRISLELWYDEIFAGGQVKRSTATLQLRYLYRFELELLLRSCRLEPRQVFGSYDLDPYHAGSPNLIVIADAV